MSCSNSPIRRWLVRRSASTSSVLACIILNASSGGRLSTSLGWSCILGGLALLLLVSELRPSVAERSALFVKELSFPQTAPADDAFFQSELGWSVLETLGRNWNYRWVGPLALELDSSTKTRKNKGRRGLRPWPLRCLSQLFPAERKYQLLRGRVFLRTFHR